MCYKFWSDRAGIKKYRRLWLNILFQADFPWLKSKEGSTSLLTKSHTHRKLGLAREFFQGTDLQSFDAEMFINRTVLRDKVALAEKGA